MRPQKRHERTKIAKTNQQLVQILTLIDESIRYFRRNVKPAELTHVSFVISYYHKPQKKSER